MGTEGPKAVDPHAAAAADDDANDNDGERCSFLVAVTIMPTRPTDIISCIRYCIV